MMSRVFVGALALLVSLPCVGEAAGFDSDCQLAQIERYFAALDKVSRAGSTVEDVDALLSLTHENVRYIHVEYDADFSKADWREGFLRNLGRGAYTNGDQSEIRILNKILGKTHVAIEYSHGIVAEDGSWKKGEPYFALFGFTDGQISLVKEFW
jgi:hypothetical protein